MLLSPPLPLSLLLPLASVWPMKPTDTLPRLPSPPRSPSQEKPDPWGVSLHFSSPTRYKQATRKSVGPPNFCCPHVWLKSAHKETFMTVVFYCRCLTGRGNLIKWVTVFMNVCGVCWGCSQLAQEHWVLKLASAVKGCRCYQPAQPVMCVRVCVWGRWKGRLKMDWEW